MIKHVAAFFAGVGASVLISLGVHGYRNRHKIARGTRDIAARGREVVRRSQRVMQAFRPAPEFDLNSCTLEHLLSLGLDQTTADRVVESRPYRSKFELVSRVLLPSYLYSRIKDRVFVSAPREAVKVAG